jgi:Lecithin retinol acyltransferase
MQTSRQELVPGSVARFKSKRYGYLLYHWGVIDWPDPIFRDLRAIHSEKDSVVKTTSLAEFSEGENLEIIWIPQTAQQQNSMLQRMHSLEGKPYDLFVANCEQVVNWALTGKSFSGQLRLATLLVLGVATLAVATRSQS